MKMTGLFHITLLPSADERKFETQITEVAFKNNSAVTLTRITSGFDHQLLKKRGPLRRYVWSVAVDLVGDGDYDFEENITKVQDALGGLAVVTGLDVYENIT